MEEANSKTARAVPPLLAEVEVSNLPGFDVTPAPSPRPPKNPSRPGVQTLDRVPRRNGSEAVLPPLQAPGYRSVQPVSISLPASPSVFGVPAVPAAAGDLDGLRRQVLLANAAAREPQHTPPPARQDGGSVRLTHQPDKVVFRSQPIPGGQPRAPAAGR